MLALSLVSADTVDDPYAKLVESNRRYLRAWDRASKVLRLVDQGAAADEALRQMVLEIREFYVDRATKGLRRLQDAGLANPDPDAAICPFVSNILVIGEGRNYCTALITLDETVIMPWAAEHGLTGRSYADVVAAPRSGGWSTASCGGSTANCNAGRPSRSSRCSRATWTSNTVNSPRV